MERTLDMAEVRKRLPTLVEEVSEKDIQIIISVSNQPKAVIMGYELFLYQQKSSAMVEKYQLSELIEEAQSLIEETQTGSVSGDTKLYIFWRRFGKLMCKAWEVADKFSKPHAMIAFQLFELSERCLAGYGVLKIEELEPVAEVLKKLPQQKLTLEDVAEVDRFLLQNKIDARFPMYVDGDLNALYEIQHETNEEIW